MAWTIKERFPSWGEDGEFPAAGFFYEGGDQVNEKHMDALWNGINGLEEDVQAALDDLDADADGEVDAADIARALDASQVGDGLNGGDGTALSIEAADISGHGLEDDGSDNLRFDAAAIGTGISGGDGTDLSLNETVIKDGGAKEVDASELSGNSGTSGQVLQSDGAAASWESISGFPSNGIAIWSGAISDIPSGWVLCDGNNGTPNLQDRFVVGAGSSYAVGDTGGADSVSLTNSEMPSHSHNASTSQDGDHDHSITTHDDSGRETNKVRTGGNSVYTGSRNTSTNGAHSHSVNVNSSGSDSAHENRPPYYALAYIMKV